MRHGIFLLGLLVACSPREKARVPRPHEKQVNQIFVLTDSSVATGPDALQFPDESYFEDAVPLRVERKTVTNLAEAEETLRVLNARPIDILFLGAGVPQKAWTQIRLPKVAGRLVVAWQSLLQRPEWLAVPVDWQGLNPFLEQLSLLKKGCHLEEKSFRKVWPKICVVEAPLPVRVGSTEGAVLGVSIKWRELLPQLLKQKVMTAPESLWPVSMSSNTLEVQGGDLLTDSVQKKVFLQEYKQWSLQSL